MWLWREHDWRNWLYGSVSKRVMWNRNLPWVTMSSADSKRLHRLRRGEEESVVIQIELEGFDKEYDIHDINITAKEMQAMEFKVKTRLPAHMMDPDSPGGVDRQRTGCDARL